MLSRFVSYVHNSLRVENFVIDNHLNHTLNWIKSLPLLLLFENRVLLLLCKSYVNVANVCECRTFIDVVLSWRIYPITLLTNKQQV